MQNIFLLFFIFFKRSINLTHHLLILSQDQVISAHGYTEDDSCDSLKAVDPLLPFWPLASNIKHPAQRDTQCKHAVFVRGSGWDRAQEKQHFFTLTDKPSSFKVSLWTRVSSLVCYPVNTPLPLPLFRAGCLLRRHCHFAGICWHFSSVQLLWKRTALRQVEALYAPVYFSKSTTKKSNNVAIKYAALRQVEAWQVVFFTKIPYDLCMKMEGS